MATFQGKKILNVLRQGEFALVFGMLIILGLLFTPLPAPLLDFMFAVSIATSIIVMLSVLFIVRAMDFNSFPTLLLVTTMLRLALSVASTRLIITDGAQSTAAAGQIIKAFGEIVMGGNFLVGTVIFLIYIIFNFMVITKGSTRIAEVSARFTLDSLPGKQMAIDADLNAGLINEEEARTRRKELEQETSFFGAMDGASKFVRGEAIAGMIITFITIVAGIGAGMMMHDMSFTAALDRFMLLTVGDGLVSMIPALIISLSAGFLISKSSGTQSSGKQLTAQLGGNPKPLFVTSGMLLLISFLPSMPVLPFWFLSLAVGGLGVLAMQNLERAEKEAEIAAQEKDEAQAAPSEEPLSSILQVDILRLEMGYGLLSLIDETKGGRLTEQIKAMRRQLAKEIGFVVPSIRIQDNMQLQPGGYVLSIKDIEVGRGELRPGHLLAMDATGSAAPIAGEETIEPTFGLPARWISEAAREEATFNGYTVVDCSTVIVTHLTEIIKDNLPDLLTRNELQKLLDEIRPVHGKLIEELIPSQVSITVLQKVLQNLLSERISVRDLPTILEAMADAVTLTKNIQVITEMVRARLSRQISATYQSHDGFIPIIALSGGWEREFADSILSDGDDRQLAMEPSKVQTFVRTTKDAFEKVMAQGTQPVLMTSPQNRPFVRSILERAMPSVPVISQSEIHPRAKIKTVGTV